MKMKDVPSDAQMTAVMSVFCNESNFRRVLSSYQVALHQHREGGGKDTKSPADKCSMCCCLGIETTAGRRVTSSKPTGRTRTVGDKDIAFVGAFQQ